MTADTDEDLEKIPQQPDMAYFSQQVIYLDGAFISNTHFYDCHIVYRGGTPPILRRNVFDKCVFNFEGPALNTLRTLNGMMNSSRGMAEFVVSELLGMGDNIVTKDAHDE